MMALVRTATGRFFYQVIKISPALAKFWPLCCQKGSIEDCLRYPEPRKVNEIALTDLRVKQALYQLSYDPAS
jgi:hypothetical protein